jgi:ATP adenylyltransferase
MSEQLQDLSNAREVMQRQIMEELAQTAECFLCENVITRISEKYKGISTSPLHRGNYWFVKNNDFPYKGSKLHLLIVPKRHVSKLEDLLPAEFLELQQMIVWVNTTYNVPGASLFIRYGETSYTGATLSHMHFHVISGVEKQNGTESILVKLGYKMKD